MVDIRMEKGNWIDIKIGDLFIFKNGLNKEKKFFGKGIPIINYMDVFNYSGLKKDNIKGLVDLTSGEIDRFNAKKGDVFFTRTSETIEEIGVSSVLLDDIKDCVFSGFILRARPKNDKLDDQFKKYCFSSYIVRKQIISKGTISTRALTNGPALSSVSLPLPPLPEQKKIASILSTVDEAIQNVKAQIERTKELKKGLMQQLFSEGIGDVTVSRLNEVVKVVDCKHRTPKYIPEGIPVFSPGTIKWGEIDYNSPTKRVSKEEYISLMDHCEIESGDMIMSRNQSIGVASIIFEKKPFVLGQDTVLIKCKDINSKYLFQFLQSNFMQKQIYQVSGGSTFARINLGDIRKLKVKFPSRENQIRIASVLFDVDSKVDKEAEIFEGLKQLKKGLMQKLLTGEVRVKI